MRWRPKKWKCPYKPDGFDDEIYQDMGARDKATFEEGADAMLKAVLPFIEREIRAHTSEVSAQAIIGSELWSEMAKQ